MPPSHQTTPAGSPSGAPENVLPRPLLPRPGSPPRRSHPAPLALAVLAVLPLLVAWASPAPASAQAPLDPVAPPPGWATDAGLAGANALVGGTLVSLARWVRGDPFTTAFREGFAGGALAGVGAYGGKRLAAERFPGAGLLGRQLHATAASAARNASEGRGLLDEVSLFLGPFRLHLATSPEGFRSRWSMSGLDLYWLVYGVQDARFSLDWRETLSSGVPVFRPGQGRRIRAGSGDPAGGASLGGVIFISDGLGAAEPRLLAHERVHVLQFDFLHAVISQPVEAHLLGYLPGGERVRDRLHPDLLILGAGALLGSRAESRNAPWEVEAHLLEGG